MNRLEPARSCRVCEVVLSSRYDRSTSTDERVELGRQMRNGMCDRCQRERYRAALLFIQASDNLRMIWTLWQMAGSPGGGPNTREGHQRPTVTAMAEAERRCVALGMWPETRDDDPGLRYVNPTPQKRADRKKDR